MLYTIKPSHANRYDGTLLINATDEIQDNFLNLFLTLCFNILSKVLKDNRSDQDQSYNFSS